MPLLSTTLSMEHFMFARQEESAKLQRSKWRDQRLGREKQMLQIFQSIDRKTFYIIKVHLRRVHQGPGMGRGLHRGPNHDRRVHHLSRAELLPQWVEINFENLNCKSSLFCQATGTTASSWLLSTSPTCTRWPWRSSSSPPRSAWASPSVEPTLPQGLRRWNWNIFMPRSIESCWKNLIWK